MRGNEINVTVEFDGMQVVGHAVSYGNRIETEITSPFRSSVISTIYHRPMIPRTNKEFREYVERIVWRSADRHFSKENEKSIRSGR